MQIDLSNFFKKINTKYKCTIITTFVIGILAQGMGLFNKFSVHDDPTNYGVGATYTSGRWMLDVLSILEVKFYGDSHYSLPVFNGFIAFFLISLSACLIIKILEIESPILCSFVAGIMVSFPVITSIFGYMFTLHFYMISLFLGVLGAYCICKTEKIYIWFVGILLMGASVGIYQAFAPFTITIILLYLISEAYKTDNTKYIIKKILLSAVSCILFILFYFLLNKLYLSCHNAVLSSYKGIDKMGKGSIGEYFKRAFDAYKEFFIPDRESNFYMYPRHIFVIYRMIIFISVILSIKNMINLIKQSIFRAIIITILIAFIPISVNFIFIMAGKSEVHSLMVYAELLPFVYFAWIIDKTIFKYDFIAKTVSIFSMFLIASLLLMYIRVDNKCYLKATYAQQEAICYFTSLVSNIKGIDGYKDDYPVAFVNVGNITDLSLQSGDNGEMSNIVYAPYYMDVICYVNDYNWILFMKQWTGYSPIIVDAISFSEKDEVKKMPSYPDYGSISIINDTIVVKF